MYSNSLSYGNIFTIIAVSTSFALKHAIKFVLFSTKHVLNVFNLLRIGYDESNNILDTNHNYCSIVEFYENLQ